MLWLLIFLWTFNFMDKCYLWLTTIFLLRINILFNQDLSIDS